MRTIAKDTSEVRVVVGNLFYDINHIGTTINVDDELNIVIYVKEN
jgi:hypothetical protein|nr:MAG TPA: hypothetical protein [Caudoviricetes sp.]